MQNQLDVIQYVGDNNVLVSKSTITNFNTKSQLIVNESQEALFYKDGQALDLFASGRHSLNTDNIPIFKKLFNKLFKDQTPFDCQVIFINKVSVLDMVWGTDSPIQLEDPETEMYIGVRANGQTGIRVVDSRKFVVKVVGQIPEVTTDSVKRYIKGALMTSVKDIIAKTIVNNKIGILEISARLKEISDLIKVDLNKEIAELGIEIVHFYVNSINANPEDLAEFKLQRQRLLAATTDAEIRRRQGYTYQEEKQFDVLKTAASNQGMGGTFISAGMGLGVGMAAGGAIGHSMTNASQAMTEKPNNMMQCPECHAAIPVGAKFCSECGKPVVIKKKFCTNCGSEITGTGKFCANCGAQL